MTYFSLPRICFFGTFRGSEIARGSASRRNRRRAALIAASKRRVHLRRDARRRHRHTRRSIQEHSGARRPTAAPRADHAVDARRRHLSLDERHEPRRRHPLCRRRHHAPRPPPRARPPQNASATRHLNALNANYNELGYALLGFKNIQPSSAFPAPGRTLRAGMMWTFRRDIQNEQSHCFQWLRIGFIWSR
jgi:hypothetical protein